jgi:hypothetical protein
MTVFISMTTPPTVTAAFVSRFLRSASTVADNVQQHCDNGKDQQDVDQSASGKSDEANKPTDYEDDRNNIQ